MKISVLVCVSAFTLIGNVNAQELGAPPSYEDCLASAESSEQAEEVCGELQNKLQNCEANESSSPFDTKDCHARITKWYNDAMNPEARESQDVDAVDVLPTHSDYGLPDRKGKGYKSHDLGVQ